MPLRPFARLFSGPSPSPKLPAAPGNWRKFDLIHALADIHGYRSMLEISTATTGGTYPFIDQSRFHRCRRLSYLTPDDWADGAAIDYRSRDRDTTECMRQIRGQGLRFDMVFVDGWHEYETASRDLQDALELVTDDGVVIAHDCLPDTEELCSPFRNGKFRWYGVSYKAHLDVLTVRDNLWYCTVDTDCGCGIVRKMRKCDLYRQGTDADAALIHAWQDLGADYTAAYRLFDRHRGDLMNVVTVGEFLAAEQASARVGFFHRFSQMRS